MAALALLAAAAWVRWRPFRVAVEGDSMRPMLEPGDWLIAIRPFRLTRGSVVVVEHPEHPGFELVKRLTGFPGDTLGALRLDAGQYWIEGDQLEASTDSRWFGPVRRDSIRGLIVFRYWPPRRLGVGRAIAGRFD